METSKRWQLARDAARRYEEVLVPAILGPAARALVEWSDLGEGESVLDVGCGTGVAARLAAEAVGVSGRVAGADVNEGMIHVARSVPAPLGAKIEWFERGAHELPAGDGEFDVALCAQTLQFLAEPQRAMAEMHRALRPGGRAALSVWCAIEESPYFEALVQAVGRRIGWETASGLAGAFGLSDPTAIRDLIEASGFSDPTLERKTLNLDLVPLREFVPEHVSATPMAPGFLAAPQHAREAVVREVEDRLAAYATTSGVRVPFRTFLAMGFR